MKHTGAINGHMPLPKFEHLCGKELAQYTNKKYSDLL